MLKGSLILRKMGKCLLILSKNVRKFTQIEQKVGMSSDFEPKCWVLFFTYSAIIFSATTVTWLTVNTPTKDKISIVRLFEYWMTTNVFLFRWLTLYLYEICPQLTLFSTASKAFQLMWNRLSILFSSLIFSKSSLNF